MARIGQYSRSSSLSPRFPRDDQGIVADQLALNPDRIITACLKTMKEV
jgi:hypothetical protein